MVLNGPVRAASPADLSAQSTHPYPLKAAEALFALGNLGPQAIPYRRAMVSGLMRPSPIVRQAAARALKLSGAGAGMAVYPEVVRSSSFARRNAVHGFGLMGLEGVGPLRRLVTEDLDPSVRREAATVLGKMGDPALSAITDLTLATEDPDSEVRVSAKGALDILACGKPLMPALSPASCYGRK